MGDGSVSFGYVWFAVLLAVEFFWLGYDSALHCLNLKDITARAEGEDKRAKKANRIKEMMLAPQIYNSTFQLVITLIQLLMGSYFLNQIIYYGSKYVEQMFLPVAVVGAIAILMYILLTFGIQIPRKLAARAPEKWAYGGVNTVFFFMWLLKPLTGLVRGTGKGILWICGLREDKDAEDVTEEDIISKVNEGHEHGVLPAAEAAMINRIIEFGGKVAKDIMTYRKHILAIDRTLTLDEAVRLMLGENKSRFPVYKDNIDTIVGILHLRDAMRAHANQELRDKPVMEISDQGGPVREAVFIPETKKIDGLFQYMQQAKTQMVIVVDEYGQTAGLIAMEDILEEIVGNIMDEYDEDEDYIEETGNRNEYLIEGKTPLDELEERLGISFLEEEFETINGFMISRLDKIPDENEEFNVDVDGYNFKIITVENNMITSVLVTKIEEPAEVR